MNLLQLSLVSLFSIYCRYIILFFHLVAYSEKYDLIGRLLKPGEEPADYTDTEEEHGIADGGSNVASSKSKVM